MNHVLLGVIGVWVVCACALFSNAKRIEEWSDGEFKPVLRRDEMRSDEAMWDAIQPISVEDYGLSAATYMRGVSPKDVQLALDKEFSKDAFPNESILNKQYDWAQYRPRIVPGKVYSKIVSDFMVRADLDKRYKLYIAKDRIRHANVTRTEKEYLITIQLLLHAPGTVYARAIELTALFEVGKIVYKDVHIVGVIHQQHLRGERGLANLPAMATVDACDEQCHRLIA